MVTSVLRSWLVLLVVAMLTVGVTARVVMAADMALGVMAVATDMPGDCGDCGDGDAGPATSLCHLVCGNPASLSVESRSPVLATTIWRTHDVADVGSGRSVRPDPSPPKPALLLS